MKIRVCRIEDGPAVVEVIDPSDGAIAQSIEVNVGEEVTIASPTAQSPADIEVGEVCATEALAEAEPEPVSDAADAFGGSGEEKSVGDATDGVAEPEPGDAGNGNTITKGGGEAA